MCDRIEINVRTSDLHKNVKLCYITKTGGETNTTFILMNNLEIFCSYKAVTSFQ
jgi:hypothetical protein